MRFLHLRFIMTPDRSPSPETSGGSHTPAVAPLVGWLTEIRVAAAFLTRFPVRLVAADATIPVASAVRAFPLVGLGVGFVGGAVYAVSDLVGMSSTIAALLAIAALVIATGGLHEDGLADCADGLGGRTREDALAIMRDSRIGTFGMIALFFVLSLRVTALSYAGGLAEAVLVMLAAAAGSRATLPALMYLLPPARPDGLGWAAGQPDRRRVVDAGAIGAVVIVAALGPIWGLLAIAAAAGAALAVGWLAHRRLGGHTGDVLGAGQQLSETGILLAYMVSPSWI